MAHDQAKAHAAFAKIPGEAEAYALADAVEPLGPVGVGAFEIEDGSGLWEVSAYFTGAPDAVALDLIAAAHGASAFVVSAVDDRDWVAQVRRELTPVRAGRIVVHGRHDRHGIGGGDLSIEIEAAMAFGTGHHGTTLGCLLAMEALRKSGWRPSRVADVGCGTGVLAIAATKLWPVPAIAGDIDEQAVATARANVAHTGARRVAVMRSAGFQAERLRVGAPYDLLLMNILAEPLKRLAPAAARALAPGGVAVLSGLLTRQEVGVRAVWRGHGFGLQKAIRLQEWATLILRKERRRP